MGNARGGHRRSEIFEDMDKILWEREPHRGIGPDRFSLLDKEWAAIWGSAQYLGPIGNPFSTRGPTFVGGMWAEGAVGRLMGTRPRLFGWESAWR